MSYGKHINCSCKNTRKYKSYRFKFINLSFPGFHSYVLRFCRLRRVDDVIICSKISYLIRKNRIWGCCLGKSPVLCIRLAIWMFIRSKELQLNKHGRAELYPGGGGGYFGVKRIGMTVGNPRKLTLKNTKP